MSTWTTTSRIKSKVDVTDRFDLSKFNPCKVHGIKPRIFENKWWRNNVELSAECGESDECLVFADVETKWNEFHPARACSECNATLGRTEPDPCDECFMSGVD